jgi:hypothetical protein
MFLSETFLMTAKCAITKSKLCFHKPGITQKETASHMYISVLLTNRKQRIYAGIIYSALSLKIIYLPPIFIRIFLRKFFPMLLRPKKEH